MGRNYTQSIQSAQRYLSIHPGNKDAPYAYYLIALCYYEQITDVTRDQKITEQALGALGELIRRYPESRYAADARLKIDLVNDHLAGKEMEIGRFYERRSQRSEERRVGKGCVVRVDIGGRRIIKKQKHVQINSV